MKINVYAMLKTLHFTIKNGKDLTSGIQLLCKTAKTKEERKAFSKVYEDIKDGHSFSQSLFRQKIASLDVVQFINMAEKGLSFRLALEKVIKYLKVKNEFERESNEKISLPVIYFLIATVVVLAVKFYAVPMQMDKVAEYNQMIKDMVSGHLEFAQVMTDILFFLLLLSATYFSLLLLSLFSQSRTAQDLSKQITLYLPFTSKIIIKFEKFMLFSMLGEMLESGISFKNVIESAAKTTTVGKFRKALQNTLKNIKHNGEFILDSNLYDDVEKELLVGVGSSKQIGSIMLEISDRARTDALEQSIKFFRSITILSIFLMAFAVFIEFYTVVLTQILIQKGFIDMTKAGTFTG